MTRLLQWFGAATKIGPVVGELLAGCKWVGIPFGGGMSEVPHIKAPTILVSDLHRHAVNLCRVVADDSARRRLVDAAAVGASGTVNGGQVIIDAAPAGMVKNDSE